MSNQRLKEYLVDQLVSLEEIRSELINAYYPVLGRTRERILIEKLMERYIRKVEHLVTEIDNEQPFEPTSVLIGSTVTVRYASSERLEEFTICFPDEVDPDNGLISFISPLGQHLLLSPKHGTITLNTPDGESKVFVQDIALHLKPRAGMKKEGTKG